MKHEPSGLLSDAKPTVDFPRRYAILAVRNEPHAGKPLVQTERRIFKNCSGLDGELALRVAATALPALLVCQEPNLRATARRTGNAVRPTLRRHVL